MTDELGPTVAIKDKLRGAEPYSIIVYDGIEMNKPLTREGAEEVADWLRWAFQQGWDLEMVYKPE